MLKRKLLLTALFVLSLSLGSCGSNNRSDTVTAFDWRSYLYTLLTTEYLWADDVKKDVNLSKYTSQNQMIADLKSPHDKWSVVITEKQFMDFMNQSSAGFGFSYNSEFVIKHIVKGNQVPALNKLRRGDRITKLDGENITQELLQRKKASASEVAFTVMRQGTIRTVMVAPKVYSYDAAASMIFTDNGTRYGYISYDSFSGSSQELTKIFKGFAEAHIEELIVDLRYNGGGSLATASILLEHIVKSHPGERQFYVDWNANNKSRNDNYTFENTSEHNGDELDMKRVAFIVTKGSASASEAVISGLKPYLGDANVITVGTNTHGKPVGMQAKRADGNIYLLINFIVKNNANQTTPFEGYTPTCTATDDLSHPLGDADEDMLKTAIAYLRTGTCLH